MKSFSTKLPFLALLGIAFATGTQAQDLAALTPKTSQTSIQQAEPVYKYTGYWFVKSGDELILVKEGNLPPGLVRKSSQYQVESIDIESVKKQLNFKHESQHNGRYVERDVFVVLEESGTGNVGSVSPTRSNGSASPCPPCWLYDKGTSPNPMYPTSRQIAQFMIEEAFYPGSGEWCCGNQGYIKQKRRGYASVGPNCTNGATTTMVVRGSVDTGIVNATNITDWAYVFCSQTN